MSEQQISQEPERVEWECGLGIHRGSWKLLNWAITTTGVGLQLGSESNIDIRTCHYHLLDLLDLIREIALQSDCLMPIVAQVPKKIEAVKDLARKQHEHHGRYLLVSENKQTTMDSLLSNKPQDIRIKPPKIVSWPELKGKIEKDLGKELYDRFLSFQKETDNSQGKEKKVQRKQAKKIDAGRIQRIEIAGFRGIKKTEKIDVDADIVLVAGANGNGKSSFVEAINLALNGYCPDLPGAGENDLESENIPEHYFYFNSDELSISLAMENAFTVRDNKPANEIRVKGIREQRSFSREPSLNILSKALSDVPASGGFWIPRSRELGFRLSTFLPEHVNTLFDEKSQGMSIAGLFPSLPDEAREIEKNIRKELKKLDEIKEEISDQQKTLENSTRELSPKAEHFFRNFFQYVNGLSSMINIPSPELVTWPKTVSEPQDLVNLLDEQKKYLARVLGSISFWADIKKKLEEIWQKHTDQAKIKDFEKLGNDISLLKQEIRELEKTLSSSEEQFQELYGLLKTVGNEEFCEKNRMSLKQAGMEALAEEIKLLKPAKAANYAKELWEFSDKLKKDIEKELNDKKKSLKKKETQWKRMEEHFPAYQNYKDCTDFLEKHDSKELLKQLDALAIDIQKLEEKKLKLAASKPNDLVTIQQAIDKHASSLDGLASSVGDALNNVLKRFVMTKGLGAGDIRVEVDKAGQVEDDDDQNIPDRLYIAGDNNKKQADSDMDSVARRKVEHFSSGQKAQMAMAWLVACRELVHNEKNKDLVHFPHRVMIMDDPSTTFDLSNLHSQAILWRQLAYNPNPKERYQVFIVSHHEEFSARLLDLLCPPGVDGSGAECRMKLLRFTKWSPEEGAQIECFDVQPQPRSLEKAKDTFQVGIKLLGEEI